MTRFSSPPRITLFCNPSHLLSRQAVAGVMRYANAVGPWFITFADPTGNAVSPRDCDGILVCAPALSFIPTLATFKPPTVLVTFMQYDDVRATLPRVESDPRAFGALAADFLLEKGSRTFVFIPDRDPTVRWSQERGAAFADRLRQTGHTARILSAAKKPLAPDREIVRLARALAKLPRPLALFAANDERARQVLDACLHAGIAVPNDALLLGVDNDEWLCDAACPRLSSIPFNAEESGFEGAKLLDDLLHRTQWPVHPPPVRLLPPRAVVERASTEVRSGEDAVVARALGFIRLKKGLDLRATDVAARVGLSNNRLETRFRQALGSSITDEIGKVRLQTILQLIRETDAPFQEIARRCGFTDASTLCHLVKEATGQTMTRLRRKDR